MIWIILGFTWALINVNAVLHASLPDTLIGKKILIVGDVNSLPQLEGKFTRFEFKAHTVNNQNINTKLRLTWFHAPNLQVGDTWQLVVHLKKPEAIPNINGFDYEKWLFAHRIRATGYVVEAVGNQLLERSNYHRFIDHIRQHLFTKINSLLTNSPVKGLIAALITGDQAEIMQSQWQVMRATGTNHLMAIAGVHIGFVAGFTYMIVQFCWRYSRRLVLFIPATQAAAMAGLIVAIIYSTLAGFSLPTQRAIIMLSVYMLSLLIRRNLSHWNAFLLALFFILLMDPLVILLESFWLSFAAVAVILYGMTGRLEADGKLWKWGRIQWLIAIGLIPFTILLFQQASLVSLVANLFAVPAVGFLVLPLCALGVLTLGLSTVISRFLLGLAAHVINLIWQVLAFLGNMKFAVWHQTMPNLFVLYASLIGVLLLLAPKGFPARWLGICWFFPLILYSPAAPAKGELWVTLLNVPHGLLAVLQTQHHTLLYGSGLKMKQSKTIQHILLPFLDKRGIQHLDKIVLSDESDAKKIHFIQTVYQQSNKSNNNSSFWNWDGVNFSLWQIDQTNLLKVSNQNKGVLLLGGYKKTIGDVLLNYSNKILISSVLIVDSAVKTALISEKLMRSVRPDYLIASYGNGCPVCRNSSVKFLDLENNGWSIRINKDIRIISLAKSVDQHIKFWQR